MSLAVVLFAGLLFTSCEKKSDAEILAGKWSVTSLAVTEDGRTVEMKMEGNEYVYYTFISGGKYVREVNAYGEQFTHEGTWVLDGNQLTLTVGEGWQVDQWFYTVKEITNSKLTLEEHNSSNTTNRGTMYLTKVK